MLSSLVNAQSMVCYVDCNPRYTSVRGESWDTPVKSLQAAIDLVAAAGGGEVWVKAGVYKPDGDDREATFLLKPNVKLLGGFRGTESDRSQRNPKANRTILSGAIGKSTDSDNGYHVVTGASGCLLDGFIISKGNANGLAGKAVGAGLLLPKGTRDFALANCTFEKNNASWQGGGVFAESTSLTLTNCMFFSNAANSGGGMATKGDTTLRMLDSFFSSNFSSQSGGAIELQPDTEAFIGGCSFMYNRSEGSGGAVSMQITGNHPARLELIDSTFNGNIAGKNAGAILFSGKFQPIISRCSFTQNVGKQGAGAIATEADVFAVIEDCVFKKNKGMKGQEDIGTNDASKIAGHRTAAPEPEPVMEEQEEAPPTPQSVLPEIHVHREPDSTVLLSDVLAEKAYCVLVLGELTDPDFIENYGAIETAAWAYDSGDVRFFYIYRHLSHPENNGYLQPFHIVERARQAQLAGKLMGTRIPWLLDTMDNQAAKALGHEGDNNSIFIYSSDGRQQFSGTITDTSAFRKALENLAGAPEITTQPHRPLPAELQPIHLKPAEVVNRIKFNPAKDSFLPLKISPQKSKSPYYVKLRAEANNALLKNGSGKVYLGFHIDPIYNMEWNNKKDPLKYTVSTPKGVLAPSVKRAPRITGQPTDSEPREFILDARQLDLSKPLSIKIVYYVSSPHRRKREKVSQSYLVHLKPDPYAGQAYRRQIPYGNSSAPTQSVPITDIHPDLLKYEANGDGRLSRKELSGTLYMKFPDIDTNGDGYLSDEEYVTYLRDR
jgi:predicted outer membrane repeat protein